jgi:hypothetical protein
MNVITYASHIPKISDYSRLKHKLKKSTARCGTLLSTSSFITQGSEQGVSTVLGAIASYTYLSLLSERVDNLEETGYPKEFFAPISLAVFEVMWNGAPFAFDFDYGATFIGFLSYKFAISSILYETVKEMLKDQDS